MPEFRSRIDNYRWQTPAFREVFSLDDLSTFDEQELDTIRETLKKRFREFNLPITLSSQRLMPSYTCYDAELDHHLNWEQVQDCIYEIEGQESWVIGFNPQDDAKAHLLLRTSIHHPLNWKHVITRITFRKANAATSFVAGVNIEQQTLIRDWESLEHFLIIGSGGSKQSVVRNILVTAMMLTTPAEFRFALIGHGSEEYRYLREAQHALGSSPHNNPEKGTRLIKGMGRELKRRQTIFERVDAMNLDDCNFIPGEQDEAILPRIILILDTLNHANWIKLQDDWMPVLNELLENGAHYGIHILLTANGLHLPHPFDELNEKIQHKLVTRSAAVDTPLLDNLERFHPSLLRFIDSFLVSDEGVEPIELPAITASDIRAVTNYWKENTRNRHNGMNILNISGNGEETVRQLVRELVNEKISVSPPIPEKPSPEALARAAEVLSEDEHRTEVFPVTERISANGTHQLVNNDKSNITVETVHRAQALATYLGWLGKGPLMDVLGLTMEEAKALIAILQARQILERGSNPTPHLHHKRRSKK